MDFKDNARGLQCLHRRNGNGVLFAECVHCTQHAYRPLETSLEYQCLHTAGLKGLGPEIDPFFGYEEAVNRDLKIKERMSQRRGNRVTSGNLPMKENNMFIGVERTEQWLNGLSQNMDQHLVPGVHGQGYGHLNGEGNMTSGERENLREGSDASLIDAIFRDLQEDEEKAACVDHAEYPNYVSHNRYGAARNANIDPAITTPRNFDSAMRPERLMESIEEDDIPYSTFPHDSFMNRPN